MHPYRIDQLSRGLAAGVPRRRLIGGLLTSFLAPILPRAGNEVAAACKKVGRSCGRNSDCCAHAECPGNKCRCRSGFRECNRDCVNSDTDRDHCGQCDNRCGTGERCCDGRCADLDTNENNCGACGSACDEQEECVGGTCVLPAAGCPAGFDGCAGSSQNLCGATDDCRCQQSVEGAPVCIDPLTPELACGQCTTSADCATIGAGAVCVRSFPGGTCCTQNGGNFCALTCAT